MQEIRKVYVEQLKKKTKCWGSRVTLAYGLLVLLVAVTGFFSPSKEKRAS